MPRFHSLQVGGGIKESKEGHFDHSLYRYAFTPDELREFLHEIGFREISISGLVNIPRLHRLGIWTISIDRWISKLPFSASRGMYLCISCRK